MEERKRHRYAWMISNTISIIVFIAISIIWYKAEHNYRANHAAFSTTAQVEEYLHRIWESQSSVPKPIYISTGILINSLTFKGPDELYVAGYIWQHFPHSLPKWIKHQFFLPDQIGEHKQEIIAQHNYPNEEVIQTHFEALIRQNFNYYKYPFDDKLVKLTIWPIQANENIILVPDFMSYENPSADKTLGIDSEIILNDFKIQESYFDYRIMHYNTNFGISNLVTQQNFPDLYLAIAIKRSLSSALVVHVIPLILVIILLFAILMMNSDRKDKFFKFNFTGTMSIGSCSALFFVLVLIHGNIRNQIYSDHVVYIEYFYFLAYILIAFVVLNNYLLLNDVNKRLRFIHQGDNLYPKIIFWPFILVFTLIISIKILL